MEEKETSLSFEVLKHITKTNKFAMTILFIALFLSMALNFWQSYNYNEALSQMQADFNELISSATFEEITTTTYTTDTGESGGNAIINESGEVNINGYSE